MTDSAPSPVLVLGMHRSGTSAVTRVINLLGVPLTDDDDLLPADAGNLSGYWESKRVTEFNEGLLRDSWASWATPPLPGDIAKLAEDPARVGEARALLREIGGTASFVLKDPRMCLLLPFWRRVLASSPLLVIVNRHPLEVARSLATSHGLTLSHGLALWEHYSRSLLQDAAGSAAYVMDYDQLLRERTWVNDLSKTLLEHGVELAGDHALAEIDRFLSVGQRHHAGSDDDLDEHCSPNQIALWRQMQAMSGAQTRLSAGLGGPGTPWSDDLLSSRRGLYVANRKLDAQAVAAAEEQRRRESLEERFAGLGRENETLKAEVSRLGHSLSEADKAQTRARMEAEAAIAAAEASQRAIDVIHASTSWRVSAPVRMLAPLRAALEGRRGRTSLVRGTLDHVRREGVAETFRRARSELRARPHEHADYEAWVAQYDTVTPADRAAMEAGVAALDYAPLISVIMPVYNTEPAHLERAVESVRHQSYPYWELCVADDASTRPDTLQALERLAASDNRISLSRRDVNGGIAGATNSALAGAAGEFVAFLDHDDELAETALYAVAAALSADPEIDILYSDEDKIDEDGRRFEPYFKPDYNRELLLAQNYFNHLTVMRRSLVEKVEGLRADLEGAQDHDLVLRVVESTASQRIAHLPYVLYHWRQFGGANTFSRQHRVASSAAGTRAVQEHLDRTGQSARAAVDPRTPGWQRVQWRVVDPLPEVTVVIPTRDRLPLLRACVDGVLNRTDYEPVQVLVVDNDSSDPETLTYLDELRGADRSDVLCVPGDFNFSALNNRAVERVDTPLVLLLNNDIEVESSDWLHEMVSLIMRPGVGAVGAKLFYGNGSIQHAGVVLGIGGVAGHAHKYRPAHETGYFGRLVLTQEVAAVTGACLLTHTALWRDVGGLDEKNLSIAFNDVDYCLRVRESGHRVVWAANAELRHLESISRGHEETAHQMARFNREAAWMKRRWGSLLRADPAYNPNLSDVHEDYSLSYPPRVARPWKT